MSGVVLISAVDPFPTDAGKKIVLSGILAHLADRHGADEVHYVLIGERDAGAPEPFPVRFHQVPAPRAREKLVHVATRSLTGRASLQESLLRSRTVARKVAAVLRATDPDLIIYDTVRMAQYARADDRSRQICYLDDLFSERYSSMLDAGRRFGDVTMSPLGNFTAHVPGGLRYIADLKVPQQLLLRAERWLIRRSEDAVARSFTRSLLVNAAEADRLVRRTGVAQQAVVAITPLVRAPSAPPRTLSGRPEFVFLGLLSLPHNDDGIRWFLRRVWPALVDALPTARLRIVGRDAREQLDRDVAGSPGEVSLEGYVDDLDTALAGATALVNPLRFGSGVKLKVIEALGRGLPVASTAVGADGIESGPDRGIVVASGPDDLVTQLVRIADPTVNATMSSAARKHFADVYSRAVVFAQYDRAFDLRSTIGPA